MDQQPSACPTEEMQPMTPAGGPAALTCGSTEAVLAWGDWSWGATSFLSQRRSDLEIFTPVKTFALSMQISLAEIV